MHGYKNVGFHQTPSLTCKKTGKQKARFGSGRQQSADGKKMMIDRIAESRKHGMIKQETDRKKADFDHEIQLFCE